MTAGAPELPGTCLNSRSWGVTGSQSSPPAKQKAGDAKQTNKAKYRTHFMTLPPCVKFLLESTRHFPAFKFTPEPARRRRSLRSRTITVRIYTPIETTLARVVADIMIDQLAFFSTAIFLSSWLISRKNLFKSPIFSAGMEVVLILYSRVYLSMSPVVLIFLLYSASR